FATIHVFVLIFRSWGSASGQSHPFATTKAMLTRHQGGKASSRTDKPCFEVDPERFRAHFPSKLFRGFDHGRTGRHRREFGGTGSACGDRSAAQGTQCRDPRALLPETADSGSGGLRRRLARTLPQGGRDER